MAEEGVLLRAKADGEQRRIRWCRKAERSVRSGRALRIVGRKVRRRRLSGGRLLIGPFTVIGACGSARKGIELKLLRREKGMKLVNAKGESIARVAKREPFYIVLRSSFRGKSLVLVARQQHENASAARGLDDHDPSSLPRCCTTRKRIFVRPRSRLLR